MSRAGWLRLVPDEMSIGHGKLAVPNPDSPLSEPRASSRALRWSIVFILTTAAFIAFAVFAFARAPKWTGLVRDRLAPEVPEGWLRLADAAKALGMARQTVLHKVQSGELEAVQVNQGRRKGLRINVTAQQTGLFDQA
jgi:hypothetical protein